MGWKKIINAKKPEPNPDQLSLLTDNSEETTPAEEVSKQTSGRTEHHWYKGYTASGQGSCSTHPSECPQGGRVQPGDKMVVIGPMKGVLPAGVKPVMMYCHEGDCARTALTGADRRVEQRIGR